MSPSTLRRYRAERLLRQEFGGLREEVLRSVRGRLRARGVHLDGSDLEACYAQAWHGLYAAIAAGEEIANPGGWLAVVTFRRAIDEHRSARSRESVADAAQAAPVEPDLAAALDDRQQLRQLFEALRGRLSARECEAASLCYLQGLTRAQAAARMGISEARMGKLMEGRGPDRPGVAGKVGELLEAIRGGGWCEQQSSQMRGLAFGILDPGGERYRLARLHQRECPACRAYILSLRGLAAVLPPLPFPWVWGLGASPTQLSRAHASGAAGAGGAAGVGGAAGGSWMLTGGSVGAKLAVSCLLALSVGCVAITAVPHRGGAHRSRPRREPVAVNAYLAGPAATITGPTPLAGALSEHSSGPAAGISRATRAAVARRAMARAARREFGPEQAAAGSLAASSRRPVAAVTARSASIHGAHVAESAGSSGSTESGPRSHAEREFGPE